MARFLGAAILLLAIGIGLYGCSNHPGEPAAGSAFVLNALNTDLGSTCTTIIAGQHYEAGSVCAAVVGDMIEVTYATTGGWLLTEAQLWLGCEAEGYPRSGGGPIPGQFPYQSGAISGTRHVFRIPLSAFGCLADFDCETGAVLYGIAHAVVQKDDRTETGWGEGEPLPGSNWAMQFALRLECPPPPSCYGYETAFAFGDSHAACFIDLPIRSNRWGWTNGPLAPGSYVFALHAGAGRCDLSRGTLVGRVTVDYDGATATVVYDLDSGNSLLETHLYVGNEILPRNHQDAFTVAPGLYPYRVAPADGAATQTYTIEGLGGDIHVVAHAVVRFAVDCP